MRVHILATSLALATSLPSVCATSLPIGNAADALAQFAPLLNGNILSTLQSALLPSSVVSAPLLVGLAPVKSLTDPFQTALAAAKLAGGQSNAAVLNDVQSCINAVKAIGSVPPGSFCVDTAGNSANNYGTAFDTMLEQFAGIMPNSMMKSIQSKTTPFFLSLGLIPPANDLNSRVNDVMTSVTASFSGESVYAIERLQSCFKSSTSGASLEANRKCFAGPNSSFVALNTLFAGVVEQFVGYLVPNAVVDVINIYSYYLSKPGQTAGLGLMEAMNPSIDSIGASTGGNSATLILNLQQCFTSLIMSPDPSSVTCVVGPRGPVLTLQVLVNGIIQQAFGVLPPLLVLQLEKDLAPQLAKSDVSPSAISTVYEQTFKVASLGPAFVTCVEALEDCINAAVTVGTSGCPTLVDHCTPLTNV